VKPTLYLDLDGVLANFDLGAGVILGTDNIYKWEFIHGPEAFWDQLNAYPNFFGSLPLMTDARELWAGVRAAKPVILTALPKVDADEVERQKRAWVKHHLGADVQVICCQTKDKPQFCSPGDVLVDDRAVNKEAWEKLGGHYVVHTYAAKSVQLLKAIGIV
jgi:hypothetical protein